jgi:thiol-disulfide isomerase/thioredoxin
MNKSFYKILGLLLLSSSVFGQIEFKGTLGSGFNLKEVYLYQYLGNKAYPFDTIPVKNQQFSKTYKTFEKGLYLLGLGDQREEIVMTEEKLHIIIPNVMQEMPWRKDSKANQDYFEIRQQTRTYDATLQALDEDYREFEYLAQADPNEFNKRITILRSSLDSLNDALDVFYAFKAKNGESDYGRKVASFMGAANKTKETYFNTTDLSTNLLASGDFILRKVNYNIMRFGRMDESNMAIMSQSLLSFAPIKNTAREVMYESVISTALSVNENQAKALYLQYKSEFKNNSKVGERIANMIPADAPTIGKPVPDIEAIDKDGNKFKLSSLRGQVVLIDFWASWCGPCRRESPNVVANYHKYKDKGFTIVSISADKDKASWLNAVQQDGYVWKSHILSADQGYKAQRDFQVQGYPTMFLIDEKGNLIETGNNLRGEGLSHTLAKVFANK